MNEHKALGTSRQLDQIEQRKKDNSLLKAYGYKWTKGFVLDEASEREVERWILHAPTGIIIEKQAALQEIAQLQMPHYGHPSALWAQEILALPNVVILDTETTGLSANDEIIDMAIIDTQGRERMNMFLQCQMAEIPAESTKVHHITKVMLKDARTFPQIWEKLMSFLETREILIYNAKYDMRMLAQTARRYHLPLPDLRVQCLMQQVSTYIGGAKRRYGLEGSCYHFQIEQTDAHRALADVQTSLKVLQVLASRATRKQG